MNYTLTIQEQKSMYDAYQENNSASVRMVKTQLKQIKLAIQKGIIVEFESSDKTISSISELESWVRAFFHFDLNTFIEN